jgi:DNA (cytosine-5)-methyltransferase 1
VTARCPTTSQERQDYDTQDFVTHPLTRRYDSSEDGCGRGTPLTVQAGVRRLTPTECERLQGFPDGWTIPDGTDWREHPKPDGPRYAQMGNAVTVPVAEWIGQRIMEFGR